ncbi:hypothetical protein [Ottowia sp.]|uniref:hypothetical protein n=1 Tax=Ottowia sp. TaxID=1898956 RepID=UPI003A877A5C
MNREQRRAARFRRPATARTQRPTADLTPLHVLSNASPHAPGEKAHLHIKTMALFERRK